MLGCVKYFATICHFSAFCISVYILGSLKDSWLQFVISSIQSVHSFVMRLLLLLLGKTLHI